MPQPIALHCENALSVEVVINKVTHEILKVVPTCGNPTLACLVCILVLNSLIVSNVDVLNYVHDLSFWNFHALNKSHDSPYICYSIFAKTCKISLYDFVVAIGVHFRVTF